MYKRLPTKILERLPGGGRPNDALRTRGHFSRDRNLLILAVVIFVTLYQWVYISWLSPVWGYMGFAYNTPSIGCLSLGCALAVFPSLWMPLVVVRPSQLIYWLIFITVYIPSLFVPMFAALVPVWEVVQLMCALFVGFAIMGLSYQRPLFRIKRITESRLIFWYGMASITLGLVMWVVVVYSDHFKLVSFGAVYEEIRLVSGLVAQGTGVSYAVTLLSGAILPFVLALALFRKNWLMFLAGVAGEVMLYAATGGKANILAILFVPGIYFLLSGKAAKFGIRLMAGVIALLFMVGALNLVFGDDQPDFFQSFSSVAVMRTLGIPGLATAHYQKFFSTHPLTYFSHVKGVNVIIEYPYDRSLGEEVGFDIYNSDEVDWNANFWATDGLAALGILGVLVISIICGLVFWLLDSCASEHDPVFAGTICCYAAANIGNTSLFTSFVSGGLGFLVLLFFLMPKDVAKDRRQSRTTQRKLPSRSLQPTPMASTST